MILYIASAYYSFSAMINCQWTLVTSKDRLPIAPILPVRKGDQESQKRMFKYKQSDLEITGAEKGGKVLFSCKFGSEWSLWRMLVKGP